MSFIPAALLVKIRLLPVPLSVLFNFPFKLNLRRFEIIFFGDIFFFFSLKKIKNEIQDAGAAVFMKMKKETL